MSPLKNLPSVRCYSIGWITASKYELVAAITLFDNSKHDLLDNFTRHPRGAAELGAPYKARNADLEPAETSDSRLNAISISCTFEPDLNIIANDFRSLSIKSPL